MALTTLKRAVCLGFCLQVWLAAAESQFGADWPEGPGSQETGAFCGACHSLAIVKQQGLTRERWDELLVWMQEKQGMPPLPPELRNLMLDYLAAHFNPESRVQR